MKIAAKFNLAIHPDRHVGPGGEIMGFNVLLTATVRTHEEALALSEWIQQAIKEKAAALPSGIILPGRIIDLPPGS